MSEESACTCDLRSRLVCSGNNIDMQSYACGWYQREASLFQVRSSSFASVLVTWIHRFRMEKEVSKRVLSHIRHRSRSADEDTLLSSSERKLGVKVISKQEVEVEHKGHRKKSSSPSPPSPSRFLLSPSDLASLFLPQQWEGGRESLGSQEECLWRSHSSFYRCNFFKPILHLYFGPTPCKQQFSEVTTL